MRTSLGDQGSQVRVLSPRFAAHCTAVKLFSLSCSQFQLAGISHFAGTSPHSLIDVLSCKTTPSRAPSADDDDRDGTANISSELGRLYAFLDARSASDSVRRSRVADQVARRLSESHVLE